MHVPGAVPEADGAVRPAREDDGEFHLEGDEAFEDAGLGVDGLPCRLCLAGRAGEADLTLAIIAESVGLEDSGRADMVNCRLEIGEVVHGGEGRGGAAQSATKLFSLRRSCAIRSASTLGRTRP
jgi:hypothetical protein